MRIMACRTHPVLDGGMHVLLGAELSMALETQRGDRLCEFEGLLAALRMRSHCRLVAGIARVRAGMDILCFQHALMA